MHPEIRLQRIDEIVLTPKLIQNFMEKHDFHVNQVFNVTPHSVEGMEWTSTMLQRACTKQAIDSVQWLLENKANPNAFTDDVEDINSIPPVTILTACFWRSTRGT